MNDGAWGSFWRVALTSLPKGLHAVEGGPYLLAKGIALSSVLHSTSPEGGPYLLAKGTATRRVALTSLPKGFHMSEGSLLPPCQRGSSPSHCIEPFLPCLCKPAITLSPGQAGSPYLHMNACAVTQLSPLAQPMFCAAHLCTEGDSSRDSGFSRTQGCQKSSKALSLELKR